MTLLKENIPYSEDNNNLNNSNQIDHSESHLLLEIQKIETFLKKFNFCDNLEKENFFTNFQQNQFQEQETLKKNFLTDINKLNIQHKNNISKILEQKKHYQQQKNLNHEDYFLLIENIKKEIKKKDLEKKEIYTKFNIQKEKIEQKYKLNFNHINETEKEKKLQKEQLTQKFSEDSKIILEKTKILISNIIKDFEQKHIISNDKINQMKKEQKEKIICLNQKYKSYFNQIQKEQNQEKIKCLKKLKYNNILFQKNLNQHNEILTQIKQKFDQKKNTLEKTINKLFAEQKLKNFFIPNMTIEPEQNQKFISLINHNKKNELKYFQNLYLWHKKYIFLKLLYQQQTKNNDIENIFLDKQKNLKIKHNNLLKEKDQEIINNNTIKEIKLLEINFLIFEMNKKYNILNIELEELEEENNLEYLYYQDNNKIDIYLNYLNYQKQILTIQKEKEQKTFLIQNQLRIEIIKLNIQHLENTIQNINQKIDLNKKKIELNKTHNKNNIFKKINFEQQKEYFRKRTSLTQLEIEYEIKRYFNYNKYFSDNLISFIDYMKVQNKIKENLFNEILKQINKCIEPKQYQTKELKKILDLCPLFINNIKNKQFFYHYVLKEKIKKLKQFRFQQKIDFHNQICQYAKKNIFYIQNIIYKNKLKNKKKYVEIENKIKIYEQMYLSLKKENISLQKEKKRSQQEQLIQKIKQIQNYKLKKNYLYQNKISSFFIKIENIPKDKSLLNKIYLKFYKFKITSYFSKWIKNINFLNQILNKEYNTLFRNINTLNTKTSLEAKQILTDNKNKIIWLSEHFLDIIQNINHIDIKNLKQNQQKEKNFLNKQLILNKKIFESQLQNKKKENDLIEENLKDVLAAIQNNFDIKFNQMRIKSLNQEKKLIQNLNTKTNTILLTKNKTIENKKILMKTYYKQEEINILSIKDKIKKKYDNYNSVLLQHKNKIIKKMKQNIYYLFLFQKKSLWKTKIMFYFKNFKQKLEIKKTYAQNQKRINYKIKIQLFLYKKFAIFL
ncbi:hypothetical protein [Columbia Basin potato purple top phytoplasma]|uniref:Uncharacterized protein n=1 Tax=Columbia Basin potato purple top phytoplasma TaxID=307134 RepID=A0ABT5L847_9MOLU|nr:hypothetical protein [Columbia Basin potato purple top phytoplasma]MDC9031854.1 hypothetical protein [Columbia Basin potato purple top phytoplasma]